MWRKRKIWFWGGLSLLFILGIIYWGGRVYSGGGKDGGETRLSHHEAQVWREIVAGNDFIQAKLSEDYSVFVNGIFLDVGYNWDDELYVPLCSIAESLHWQVSWLPDVRLIQLYRDGEESRVDIVDFWGKPFVRLAELPEIFQLAQVDVDEAARQIKIQTHERKLKQVVITGERFSLLINGMKMTERAFCRQGEMYVPTRIFALSWGKHFRYDADQGEAYIGGTKVESIFAENESYATLAELQKVIETRDAVFSFAELGEPKDELQPVLYRGTAQKAVALTFDDYLSPEVDALLPILDEYGLKATFFVIGNNLADNQELLQTITQKGHLLANHTWDHLNLYALTDDEIRAQLIAPNLKLAEYGIEVAPYFRPPGGFYDERIMRIAQDIGLRTVLWSLNSYDGDPANGAKVVRQAVERWIQPGAIVVMHTQREATLQALPGIIENLQKRGYEFVTLAEMVTNEEKSP